MSDIQVPIGKLLEEVAKRQPDHTAVVYSDRGLRYTYEQFDYECRKVAKGFMALGIERGEHLAIWSTNKPEWLTSQFATGKMGAVLVTVNTNYQTSELEYLLKQSDATTLILMDQFKDSSYVEMLYEVVPELRETTPGELNSSKLPKLKNVIFLGEESHPGMYSWRDILTLGENVSDQALDERMNELNQNDVINMQYTSGTTGFPKGVMLTHHNLTNNAVNIASCMNLTSKDKLCIPVPFFHCFGCVLGTLASVSVGATMVPVEEFSPTAVLEAVSKERCTALHGVPTMFISELNDPNFHSYDLSSLRTGIMAGSNCPIEVMKAVVDQMGASEITIAYGQTEASPVITQTRVDDPLIVRVESVGRALPNVEVKIIDLTTGEEAAQGMQGELWTRGYHVMKGYYKNPEATKAAITEDGWLRTGDLAVMDEGGYCRITGRLKDMIIRGGENIYPREIEEFLYKHPAVLDVQVVGIPDDKYGEEVSAWIKVKEGVSCTEDGIRDDCRGKIASYKIPRYIAFVKEFPMTASGKIQKFKLKQLGEKTFRKVSSE
ncbi:AMP-binding protein [Bacillus sp. FJAT-45037]|uniref:AMP-binding protein n=1 Tax=Bacillus sp. FJAT-45037 TaxID=2011007 RepID=UPI000C2495EC|nr:AMP-binding protein [Bacillus sp. FJAT-45037]